MVQVKQSSSARIVLIVPFQLRYLTSIQPEVKSAAAMTLIQRIESAQSELALSNLLQKKQTNSSLSFNLSVPSHRLNVSYGEENNILKRVQSELSSRDNV